MPRCANCGKEVQATDLVCPHCGKRQERGSQQTVGPVLYARVVLEMERGNRQRAIMAVAQEMQLEPAAAEAIVDRLWRQRQQEVSAQDLFVEPWYTQPLALLGFLVVAVGVIVALALFLARP